MNGLWSSVYWSTLWLFLTCTLDAHHKSNTAQTYTQDFINAKMCAWFILIITSKSSCNAIWHCDTSGPMMIRRTRIISYYVLEVLVVCSSSSLVVQLGYCRISKSSLRWRLRRIYRTNILTYPYMPQVNRNFNYISVEYPFRQWARYLNISNVSWI